MYTYTLMYTQDKIFFLMAKYLFKIMWAII